MILRKTHTTMTRSLNKYVQRMLDWDRGQKYPSKGSVKFTERQISIHRWITDCLGLGVGM